MKSAYYDSPLGCVNLDWFVNEIMNLENKMASQFKNGNKDFIMTEEVEKRYRDTNNCRFCEKNIKTDKFRDHCHLTGKNRGRAYQKCKINVTQKRSKFILFVFHNLSICDCHLFFEKLVIKKNEK